MRMKTDRGFVEDVERADEPAPETAREADPLHLPPGEGSGLPVQRQIPESDFLEKRGPVLEFAKDRRRDLALKPGEVESCREPAGDLLHGPPGDFGDVPPPHADVQRLGLQAVAVAFGTPLGKLILAQKDADVRLVPLLFLRAEKGDDAPEAFPRVLSPVQQDVAAFVGKRLPREGRVESGGGGELSQARALAPVTGLRPWIEGAFVQRTARVGNDELGGVLEHGAEARAGVARSGGAVEAEQLGGGLRKRQAAGSAAMGLFEVAALGCPGPVPPEERDGGAPPLGKGRGERIRDPFAVLRAGSDPVHDHERLAGPRQRPNLVPFPFLLLQVDVRQIEFATVGEDADVPPRPEVLHHPLAVPALFAGNGEGDGEPRLRTGLEEGVGGRRHGVRHDGTPALRTHGRPDARPQEPQVVVDLRDRADGGAARLHPVALVDGDGGTHALDEIDVGLRHPLEKLLGVGGERLDVTPLSLGVDRVEGEAGFSRT